MRTFAFLTMLVFAACSSGESNGQAPVSANAPVEQGAANASFSPAFAGQTRAPAVRSDVEIAVTEIADGLSHPWAVEPLPDGRLLVTERAGRLRVIAQDGTVSAPVAGLPAVDARGQGGLLDVALSPDFARDRLIY